MASLWFETALLPGGWVDAVRIDVDANGCISTITADAAPVGAHYGVALPGLCNLHSHAFQRGMAGLAEARGDGPDSFWSWREIMYRFVDRIDPDDVAAIAAQAYVEMVEAGFTRVGEFHYLHHDIDGRPYAERGAMAAAIAEAAAVSGIALTLLPVLYAASDFGGVPPLPAQRRFVNSLDDYVLLLDAARAAVAHLPDASVGVAPHSLRAVPPPALAALPGLARGGPLHIHIAEQQREVDACLAWSGARPVEWLLANAEVGADWCLVHATHIDAAELRGIAAAGAAVGLCPITEANLGDGIFPARDFLAAGGRIGIGSDSNVRIDAAEELRLLEYGQRLTHQARNVLASPDQRSTGARLFGASLSGGAQALGTTPGLAVGAPADLFAFAADDVALAGRRGDALIDCWVFGGAKIDAVWRRGRQWVQDGRHVARDAVAARYRATLRKLLA